MGIEPTIRVLQTRALPLGYVALLCLLALGVSAFASRAVVAVPLFLPLSWYHGGVSNSGIDRRSKGAGSQRSNGRWRVRVSARAGTRDFYGRTHKEARAKADAWSKAAAEISPVHRRASRITLVEWLAEWLDEARGHLKPQTWSRYERFARLQLVPVLGRVRLAELRPDDIARLHAALRGTDLSGTSQHHAHVVLGTALQAALDRGLIAANPARAVRAPKLTTRERTILSREEARNLIGGSRDDPYHALYVLALTTGMRIGELLALQWRDVDLERSTLTVKGTVVRTLDGDLAIHDPKTRSARRQIALSSVALSALGAKPRGDGLVFPSPRGDLMSSQNMSSRHFRPMAKRAGCPRSVTLHDLRHTCATHLLEDGVPAHVVSRMLGHASVAITLSIYAHVTPRLLDAASAAMDARYGPDDEAASAGRLTVISAS